MRTTHRMAALGAAMCCSFAAAPTLAYQAGDMVLRAGAAGVFPNADSDELTTVAAGAKVDVDSDWSLGITFTYMVSDNLGVGVLAAWPFEHDIEADGSISSLDTVASTKHLPPTVTLQWHFPTGTALQPYVGAGINYTIFFDEDTEGALSSVDIELDDSWGLAAEAGVDYQLDNDWLISGQIWYLDIDTEAKISGGIGKYDVEIDPWVYMLSVGKKF